MINIKIKEAADILNAGLWGTYDWDKPIKGVSIDSRKVTENSLFIPIKGMTVNGHAFVKDAIEKGAAASLWNKDEPNPPEDIALILVEDTVKSLQDLSRYYRNKLNVKIVGVTGSNGKTSTKDITAAILPPKQFVLLSTLLGILLIDDIDPKDQLILGKFINNISNTIFTAAAQEKINIKKED
jgi:UDP-N-acetylmuramoyl-tripeptide--D-alanyl-D-alanine ligase